MLQKIAKNVKNVVILVSVVFSMWKTAYLNNKYFTGMDKNFYYFIENRNVAKINISIANKMILKNYWQ